MAVLTEYLWMAVVGGMFGFVYAFGIGANDVANAFETTVASKSLTLKQAVLVASIFEFAGALLLGASVTSTVRNSIFNPAIYEDQPEIVMLGMFCSLITGSIMLLGATYFGLPVSTTHTIVGCIMGFSIVAEGFSSINWSVATAIFISWIASPGVSGILAFIFFYCIRRFILHTENPFQRTFYTFPLILTIFIGIDLFYVLYKGMNNAIGSSLSLAWVLPVSFGTGFLAGLVWIFIWGPWAKRRIEAKRAEDDAEKPAEAQEWDEVDVDGGTVTKVTSNEGGSEHELGEGEKAADGEVADEEAPAAEEPKGWMNKSMKKFADSTYNQDLKAQSLHESKRANEIWDDAEQFDEDSEHLFGYVQVFTACLNSFAHGANDVANAIAPLSAIIFIYQTGDLQTKSPVQKWILAYGGVGIVLGLLCFGYRVIKSIGYKLSALSPSRGGSAELAASLFVVTASFLGIPVSSTQSIVGAVAGIGLVGGLKNLQWLFLLRVCVGWVVVFFSAVLMNAGLFAMFAFSPSLTE